MWRRWEAKRIFADFLCLCCDMAVTLAELCICACAEVFRNDNEKLASGIGVVPRLGVGLARLTFAPGLMVSDGQAILRTAPPENRAEGWVPYARSFDILWAGRRHAMTTPVQIDRFGQTNLSFIKGDGDFTAPKVALLGPRGLPGNTVNHPNSMFFPDHSVRSFVAGEVDMVCGVGYNPQRWPENKKPCFLDLRQVITNLAVLDFGGPKNQMRVRSLHPGVTFEDVQKKTGFLLAQSEDIKETPRPTEEQLRLIREVLDPNDTRATVFKGNPEVGT